MTLVKFSSILAVPAIIICTCMGCGSGNPLDRQPISGAVTINGTPLEKGSIQFEPLEQKGVASGAVITAGKYSISETKGLPTGKYKVLISSIGGGAGQDAPKGPPGTTNPVRSMRKRELIPDAYNRMSTQVIEVCSEKPNHFEFDIKM